MSISLATLGPAPALPATIGALVRREPAFAAATVFLLAMMAPTGLALVLDGRLLNGVNVWIKPLKFEISLALYLATLAWVANLLPQGLLLSRRYRVLSWMVVIAVAAEMLWIGGAAYLGIASHFNVGTPVMQTLYSLMGILAITITVPSLVYGVALLRYRDSELDPALRLALGIGLVLTCVLTVFVAGFMAGGTSHGVGGSGSDAGGVPFLGWSRDGGDLRVAHFFATHAMHFIPAIGYVAARTLPGQVARRTVIAFSAAFVGFIAYAFLEAFQGKPFLTLLIG